MPNLPTECPSCGDGLRVTRLRCPGCDMQLEGGFDIHPLLKLRPDDLGFVLRFVRASGSLKEMAGHYGHSYPTIRNRLNDIIAKLDSAPKRGAKERHQILDAIARGEMSVKEAAKKLAEVEDD